jgi:hypothetical protein
MGILFLQHIKRDTEETVYDSRPRGRGGRGRKGRRRLGITNSTLCLTFIDYGNNSKTENRVQKGVQRSSAAEFQQDLQISASNRINNVPQNTRFNADEVERNLQQRYEEALNSALQNASGTKLCKTNHKPWSKGSAPVISSKDFLAALLVAQKDFENNHSARSSEK